MDNEEMFRKIRHHDRMDKYLENEMMLLSENNIDLRLKFKKSIGEKIKVVFVCHRPTVWRSLKTVYEAMQKEESFEVKIVAIPNKKLHPEMGLSHEIYESEGSEDFFRDKGCINGYDYEEAGWLDLRTLNPDYIFFQQPYNVTLPKGYKSWFVSKYAKLCYVAYGYEIMGYEVIEGTHPADFFQNVSFYFSQDTYNQKYMEDYFVRNNNNYTRSVLTGFPKFDNIDTIKDPYDGKGIFKAVWCPRWATDEGNCHFFDYKDFLFDYFESRDDLRLTFRPHPQMLSEMLFTKEMTETEIAEVKNRINRSKTLNLDTEKDYWKSFDESDCLIADPTSMMGDYFLSGKPIVYCHRREMFGEGGADLSKGFYWVRNREELKDTIDMLSRGDDPLFEKRQNIIKNHYYLPPEGAGERIKDIIKADALK